MKQKYDASKVARDYTDKDGWLTIAKAEGGKKRLTFDVAIHRIHRPSDGMDETTSDDIYAKLLEHPEDIAIVLADVPEDADLRREPLSCVLASVCDAAGLIKKGKTIVCLDLCDYDRAENEYGRPPYSWGSTNRLYVFGFTAEKHDKIARELIEAGAELIVAPLDWDGGEAACHVVEWINERPAYDYAAIDRSRYRGGIGYATARQVPIIDVKTKELIKIAGSFKTDGAEGKRKVALGCAKEIFKGLKLTPEEAVELLSYGLIEWSDAKSKSYKVPRWKKFLVRTIVESFPEYNGGNIHDDTAEKLSACTKIWKASLKAYGVAFKEGTENHDEIVRAWKEIGGALGVDSSIRTVLEYGVPVDDVVAAI